MAQLTVKHKINGYTETISSEAWETLIAKGISKNYEIIKGGQPNDVIEQVKERAKKQGIE